VLTSAVFFFTSLFRDDFAKPTFTFEHAVRKSLFKDLWFVRKMSSVDVMKHLVTAFVGSDPVLSLPKNLE